MVLNSLSLSLLPSASTGTTDLMSILYGNGTAATTNPVTALQTALATETKSIATQASQPDTKRDIAAFKAALAKAKTPQDLLKDPSARKVLLTANGLGDQSDYAALATKALMSDTTKDGSLASKLTDTRWLAMAKTYDFANQGLAVLKKSGVVDTLTQGYAEVQWRQTLDQSTPGLSNAPDFRERAKTMTTALQILGDSTAREVVTVALGIPKQIAFQSIEAQEKAITSRLDISKFQSPSFVDQFTKRYLVAASTASASTTTTAASTLVGLFA